MAALPSTEITTSMVANAIGAASNDVGTLCSHSNVNKWSKWKPVSLAKVTGLTESDLSSVKYGFTIPSANAAGSDTLSASWTYNKPTGGSTSPYRLGDFRNYQHSSEIPYSFLIPSLISKGSGTVLVKMIPDSTLETGNLTCADLFANMYLGIMIKRGTEIRYKTATTKIPDGVSTINIADCTLVQNEGDITIYCFYTPTQIPSWTSTAEQMMYSLNGDDGVAYKTATIAVPEEHVYGIGLGLNKTDRSAIRVSNVSIDYSNQTIGGTGAVLRELVYSYMLDDITVTVTRDSDGEVIHEQTYDTDTYSSPVELLSGELEVGMQLGVRSTLYVHDSDFEELPPNDHYVIIYTLNYHII